MIAKNKRGTYNAEDLNRVGEAVAYVADLLSAMGYDISVNPKTDWQVNDIPRMSEMVLYCADLFSLRDIPTLPGVAAQLPASARKLTYEGANNIELFLQLLGDQAERIPQSWCFAGDLYSGEV